MYNLEKAKDDFPWTRMSDQDVIDWGIADMLSEDDTPIGWFDGMPPGWGNIIHDGLAKIDAIITDSACDVHLHVEQVKEKFGTLRFYVGFLDKDEEPVYDTEWAQRIRNITHEMETETEDVCCFCGRKDGIKWRHGWVHLSCDECEDKNAC